jgi:hypothetical protein
LSILRPSKIYPNWDFWFENIPSGNTEIDPTLLFLPHFKKSARTRFNFFPRKFQIHELGAAGEPAAASLNATSQEIRPLRKEPFVEQKALKPFLIDLGAKFPIWERWRRADRFFLLKFTKTGKIHIPNYHKIYQQAVNYCPTAIKYVDQMALKYANIFYR